MIRKLRELWRGLTSSRAAVGERQAPLPEKACAQPKGYSAMPAGEGAASDAAMFNSLLRDTKISHRDLNNLSRAFFNVELEGHLYCFRTGGPYGIVFAISGAETVQDARGSLCDIRLTLSDCSMDTSLLLQVSVKDVSELLRPFVLEPFVGRGSSA